MSGKKEGLYHEVFQKISELAPTLSPEVAMSDYESAIGNALMTIFPNVRLTACRFHYGQAILRKLKAVGLQSEYIKNPQIRKWGKKFISMCLLPPSLVRVEVNYLQAEADRQVNVQLKEKMKTFLHYYERFWMMQKTPEVFSVHGLRHRTNNVSESIHSKMNKTMTAHPGFWRFLEELNENVGIFCSMFRAFFYVYNT